jgi:hypothetical protein
MPNLILLFNHRLTAEQAEDARSGLGVRQFIELPEDLRKLWQQVPASIERIKEYLEPLARWLQETSTSGDYVLIQGDFGATYLMIWSALELNLVPVYATTAREAFDTVLADGTIQKTQHFRHVMFRRYGE